MRVRDKRRQQREQKAQKLNDEQKSTDTESKAAANEGKATTTTTTTATTTTTTSTAATTTTTQSPPQSQSQSQSQPSTLPATEKVAFDNRIKRKNVLALNEKVAALREYDRQPVYKHVGRMFNCSPDQIKRIVQQKEEILRAWDQRTRRSQDARTQELKVVRVSMLGKAVYEWIRRMMYYKDFIISDGLIQKMALQFKSSMGLNKFFPHQEWCDKFRITYNIQHNDTKLLKIGYTQSQSVQINDIAKDVMSECTPAAEPPVADEDEDVSLATISGSSHADEDDVEVDIDGGGDISDELEDEQEQIDTPDVKPSISELNQAQSRVLQPLPQLMLPQVPPGTSQKVLLATPILPPGATTGGAQTMTIIPLATLAQSITQRPVTQPQTMAKAGMPPPKLDIKQEIKTEPKDADEQQEQEQQQQKVLESLSAKSASNAELQQQAQEQEQDQEPPVRIKQELDSDSELLDDLDDDDDDDDANGGRSSVTSLAEILAANVDAEKQYIEHTRAMRQRKRSLSPVTSTAMTILPPMPTLTKAPVVLPASAKRQRQHDDNNNAKVNADSGGGQSIISCAEARKYLKLLEEFALSKENYRLIGLITRADEVMRELADE